MAIVNPVPASSFAGVDSQGTLHVAVGIAEDAIRGTPGALHLSAESGSWKYERACIPERLPREKTSPYPPLWWFAFSAPSPTLRHTIWRLCLTDGGTAWEVDKRAGFPDRKVLAHLLVRQKPFSGLSDWLGARAAQRELARSRPMVALHAWNPEIASEMLGRIPLRREWSGLRLLFPHNIPSGQRGAIEAIAASMGFPHVETETVPPKGRDVGGLVTLLGDLKRPCLYLHTKQSAHLPPCVSHWWRDRLMHPLVTPHGIAKSLLGMRGGNALVYARECQRVERASGEQGLPAASAAMAVELGKDIFSRTFPFFRFCAGTMMWINPAQALRVWTRDRLRLVLDRLEDSATMAEPSMAHAFERLFPQVLEAEGIAVAAI